MKKIDSRLKTMVANELKFCRQEKELTIKSASRISGIANSTICYYENAKGSMTLDVIIILLETYNVTTEIFFKRIIAKMREDKEE